LFHPIGSRFTNQTTSIKRGSSIFFSGALSLIEDQLYLELQNFSFIKNNQSLTEKPLPWSKSPQTQNNSISFAAQIHSYNKKSNANKKPPISNIDEISKISDQKSEDAQTSEKSNDTTIPVTPKSAARTRKNLSVPTPISTKRKTRSSNKTSNKMQKLSDIASNIISLGDSDEELENE